MLDQVRPRLRNADELHDLLLSLVAARPHGEWAQWFEALVADGRAELVDDCWVATERREAALALADDDEAAAACVAGHLQLAGPVTVEQLVADAALPSGAPMGAPLSPARARTALARLEGKGSAIELPDGRWCARNLLVRLHGASRSRRRGMVDPVPIAEYVRFLTHWQHATPDSRVEGRAGLLEVLEQLQGIEAPAAEWEAQILPARVTGYDARWLDELCLSGEIVWGRLTPRAERTGRSGTPSPATPLAFVLRDDLEDMLRAVRAGVAGAGARDRRGGRRARCAAGARRLLPPGAGAADRPAPGRGRRGPVGSGGPGPRHRGCLLGGAGPARRPVTAGAPGRSAAPPAAWRAAGPRWGRVSARAAGRSCPGPRCSGCRRSTTASSCPGTRRWPRPWRSSCWCAGASSPGRSGAGSRSRCRGARSCGRCAGSRHAALVLGGRFVAGLSGEQYALPEAFDELQATHRRGANGEQVVVAGADPLNMTGSILGGARVPTRRNQRVVYRDGVVVDQLEAG